MKLNLTKSPELFFLSFSKKEGYIFLVPPSKSGALNMILINNASGALYNNFVIVIIQRKSRSICIHMVFFCLFLCWLLDFMNFHIVQQSTKPIIISCLHVKHIIIIYIKIYEKRNMTHEHHRARCSCLHPLAVAVSITTD